MTFYILFRNKSKSDSVEKIDKIRIKYQELYIKHEIDIIGIWRTEADETETFYFTRFQNDYDFNKKVKEGLYKDEAYVSLRPELEEASLEIDIIRLLPLWIP